MSPRIKTPRARRGVALLATLATLALPACSGGPPAADGTITLTEFAIGVPGALDAGYSELEIAANGVAHHSLSICPASSILQCDGERVEFDLLRTPPARDTSLYSSRQRVLVLGAGWDARIGLELEPGTYRIWCSIVNHAASGMQQLITVR